MSRVFINFFNLFIDFINFIHLFFNYVEINIKIRLKIAVLPKCGLTATRSGSIMKLRYKENTVEIFWASVRLAKEFHLVMMYAADFRRQAREKLGGQWTGGKWATFALISLIYTVIVGVCGALSYIYIGAIALFIIMGPLTLGMAMVSLRVMRDRDIKIDVLFGGFKDMSRSFVLYILIDIFTALWSLLFVIPGIIMSYAYSMSYYILADHPTMTPNEARKKSIEIMRGNKWRLFCLHFSFIGWLLLSALTFGILEFWVIPYMETAQAAFYEEVAKSAGLVPDNDAPTAANFVTSGYAPRTTATNTSASRFACPACGAMNNAEAKFCSTCGKKLESAVCHNCGAINGAETKFCSKCGHKLGGIKCAACGTNNEEGTKFCTKCGAKLEGLKCQSCGAINEDGTKFCVKCGTKLESGATCPTCGTHNAEGAKFCSGCGKSLVDNSTAKVENGVVCPECGTHNDTDTKFCINCGKKLK